MVRVWIDGEDYGTFGDWPAELVRQVYAEKHPAQTVRLEPVADQAPEFLRPPADFERLQQKLKQKHLLLMECLAKLA